MKKTLPILIKELRWFVIDFLLINVQKLNSASLSANNFLNFEIETVGQR